MQDIQVKMIFSAEQPSFLLVTESKGEPGFLASQDPALKRNVEVTEIKNNNTNRLCAKWKGSPGLRLIQTLIGDGHDLL